MNVELLTDLSQLEGTGYFEFAIGAHTGTHWGVGSVFVEMDVFDLIQNVVAQTIVGYNPYGPTVLSRDQALQLFAALKELGRRVGRAVSPEEVLGGAWESLDGDLRAMPWKRLKSDLARLVGDLRRWLDDISASGRQCTILGI